MRNGNEEKILFDRYGECWGQVECAEGNNALDQQLMGVLSYLIAIHPNAECTVFLMTKVIRMPLSFGNREVYV